MINLLNKIKSVIASTVIFTYLFGLIPTTNMVYATPLSSGGSSSSIMDMMFKGDVRYTKNQAGAIVTEIPAGMTADTMFEFAKGAPIVWAKYYEPLKIGFVQVTRVQRNFQTGGVTVIVESVGPGIGSKWAKSNGIKEYYGGHDPFENFIKTNAAVQAEPSYAGFMSADVDNSNWYNISAGQFYTAVGVIGSLKSTTRGYVSYIGANEQKTNTWKWDECIKRVGRACIKTRYHSEAEAMVKPKWLIMTTAEQTMGVAAAIKPYFTAPSCIGSATKCNVVSPLVFMEAGEESDFAKQTDWTQLWHHEESSSGWAAWAIMLVVITAVVLTAGAGVATLLPGSVLLEAGAGLGMTMAAGIVDLSVTSVLSTYAVESAFYVGVSQISHPGGSMRNSQQGMFGNLHTNNPNANVPVSSATQTLTGGDFNQDSRLSASTPIAPNSGNWDPRSSVSNTWFNNKIDQTGQNAGVTYGGRSGFDEQYGNHVHDANRSDGLSNIYNNKKLDANLEKDKQNDVVNGKESGFVFDGELIQQ